ncbi:unnamed protein product [Clonostachys rosea]|uniref:Ribosome biogenesis protein SLX9 n=1 Tax=Bionectria ochroleuca TaxID=29856 RepID=A0ABY6UCM1_BIOOC|nr:unnamed protein product [Clonostachys rosea]
MVAITPAIVASLSILGMVQSGIALSGTEADSLAVVRGISDTLSEEVYHNKRGTGKLPKPVAKAGQAAVKVASKLPGQKHLKAAAGAAENKLVKTAVAATKAKNSIKNKLGKRDLEELEVYFNTRATGKLPKPVAKAGQAAAKVASKLPGQKHLKAAAGAAENKLVKTAVAATKAKNSIKNKLSKRELEELEVYFNTRATGKLPKPVQKAGQAAIKVASKLPGQKHLKAAAGAAENKLVKTAVAATKAKNSIKNKLGRSSVMRAFHEDYDVEVRDFDDEISWE